MMTRPFCHSESAKNCGGRRIPQHLPLILDRGMVTIRPALFIDAFIDKQPKQI